MLTQTPKNVIYFPHEQGSESLLSYIEIFKELPKMMNYLFPPKAYRRKKSTSHTLICLFLPCPIDGLPSWRLSVSKNLCSSKGPRVSWVRQRECTVEKESWKQWYACAWLSWELGMRSDISRESRQFANSPDQKKRELGECPALELHQHIPAWLTLVGGLCFSIRAGKQGLETWPVLFLTLSLIKLSFHRLAHNSKFPLNWLKFSHHQLVEWKVGDSTFRTF